MSPSIKKITVVLNHHEKIELTNLPFYLEQLTIVYTSMQTAQQFYDVHKAKIKLPYGCKLKIIQNLDINKSNFNERHLNIKND